MSGVVDHHVDHSLTVAKLDSAYPLTHSYLLHLQQTNFNSFLAWYRLCWKCL